MPKSKATPPPEHKKERKKHHLISSEARENELIDMAIDLAEQQIRDGTASSQVITHFLRLGSQREKLEREKLKEENKLLKAKTEAYESTKRIEELYSDAISAMRRYGGSNADDH